jgi:uncharacterized cupredoxin-like copper-binding protein
VTRTRRTRLAFAVTVAVAVTIAAVPASARVAGGVAQARTIVRVTGIDFQFLLSRKKAPKGTVTFRLSNNGYERHDFKINGKKTRVIDPGETAAVTVTFTKKGKYTFICTVPGHARVGMKGTFTIT